jgi:nitrate/nitrite-specific signal transduction histidine kinase
VVLDNGKGFAPAAIKPERNGMTNMAQRMNELGGDCRVTSQPGKGCRVEFSVPLKRSRRHPGGWAWNTKPFADRWNETGKPPNN